MEGNRTRSNCSLDAVTPVVMSGNTSKERDVVSCYGNVHRPHSEITCFRVSPLQHLHTRFLFAHETAQDLNQGLLWSHEVTSASSLCYSKEDYILKVDVAKQVTISLFSWRLIVFWNIIFIGLVQSLSQYSENNFVSVGDTLIKHHASS